jgi:hypothetical protein
VTAVTSADMTNPAEWEVFKEDSLDAKAGLDAKVGAVLIGCGFYDRMKDMTPEDDAETIVAGLVESLRPIVSDHLGRRAPTRAEPSAKKQDELAARLDEIADLCEHWKKNRSKGHTPTGIRVALVISCEEISAVLDAPAVIEISESRKTDAQP